MKMCFLSSSAAAVVLVVAFSCATVNQGFGKDAPAKTPGKLTLNIQTVPEVAIPQSSFSIPSVPAEGRNPFFPQSVPQTITPKVLNKETPLDTSWFILNGITSPPKRTAMINGRTFEPGEEGEIRLPTGSKVLIRCEEIKADSATIRVNGQIREVRMRSGL